MAQIAQVGNQTTMSTNKTQTIQRYNNSQNEAFAEVLVKIVEGFQKERDTMSERLKKELYPCLKKVEQLNDAQIIALSIYQECIEEAAKLRSKHSEMSMQFQKNIQDGIVFYTTGFALGLKTNSEKQQWAEVDNANLKRILDEIQSQIRFYEDTLTNIKSFNYAIKNKLEIAVNELV